MELQMAYDEDYDKAVEAARWWAPTVMPIFFKAPISDPREIEAHAEVPVRSRAIEEIGRHPMDSNRRLRCGERGGGGGNPAPDHSLGDSQTRSHSLGQEKIFIQGSLQSRFLDGGHFRSGTPSFDLIFRTARMMSWIVALTKK
jgi:hypothetical protein